ncbi:D-tagatose-bisphosphate aldolase, class II, non-catalytic subunit [Pseudaminobacter manganicus]|uniref:D-tagatose-bisphosphate aldolase, class II, non-catalytic subunit n=2 Tax=Manganibacter manganicus TaxID=1873176 RepID=A0A1V8RQG5_9HYPH|nr:D-tagatose-bisphosphate aldolase, class II, non-catalytic subunit [Pseudaminobacter manganicus]OQM75436.1 D-tagatose-bisphosphate aldolase, class II, non-catalytic subunit [Pseudaminobacter manganicus]
MDPLLDLAPSLRVGKPKGIVSVCSSHPLVIRAAIRDGVRHDHPVLVEATCNQVNQFGGYTGMRPADFLAMTLQIAQSEGLPADRVIFGGDHLGPNPWRAESAEVALAKAEDMVAAYVEAGFRKIHLDASMGCAGEPAALDDTTIARRAARLARRAEQAASAAGAKPLLYVIGTEVPPPGGADHVIDAIEPTRLEAVRRTWEIHREVFEDAGLAAAFSRIIAIVVQPGVEFGNENVVSYDREKAQHLAGLLRQEEGLVYEAHSTDYQTPAALRELVEDGFAILKVGPQLTFDLRQALYGLDVIASDMLADYGSRPLFAAMEALMVEEPRWWRSHYRGNAAQRRVQRHYSLSDRIRYYWNHPAAVAAVDRLIAALAGKIVPAPLLRQHLPGFESFTGSPLDPRQLLITAVETSLEGYRLAVGMR